MPWLTRGLRDGIVTSRYPRRPDDYGTGFHATVSVLAQTTTRRDASTTGPPRPDTKMSELEAVAASCPTGAISLESEREGAPGSDEVRLDRGRCIACGRCVEARPDRFAFDPTTKAAELHRDLLVVPQGTDDEEGLARLRAELTRRVRALRRSVHIRHVDCGSDGSEEWEIAALTNPIYDVQRLGIYFTASPRHADLLLVTGIGATGMLGPLRHTYDVMPEPKVVVALGSDAASGGLYAGNYATRGGIGGEIGVDVYVPGSPPSPFAILYGILLGTGRLERATSTGPTGRTGRIAHLAGLRR